MRFRAAIGDELETAFDQTPAVQTRPALLIAFRSAR